jgi:hypothetical protein
MRELSDLTSPVALLPPSGETLLLIAIEFRLLGGPDPNRTGEAIERFAVPVSTVAVAPSDAHGYGTEKPDSCLHLAPACQVSNR